MLMIMEGHNNNTAYNIEWELYVLHNTIFIASVVLTPFFLGVNIFFITGIVLYPSPETPHNHFLLSLCFADLLPGAITVPFSASAHSRFPAERSFCIFWLAMCTTYVVGVFYSLLLLSVDRYISFTYPYVYIRFVTIDRIHIVLVIKWMGIYVLAFLPLLFLNKDRKLTTASEHCDYYFVMPGYYLQWALLSSLGISIALSATLNIHLLVELKRLEMTDKKDRESVHGNNRESVAINDIDSYGGNNRESVAINDIDSYGGDNRDCEWAKEHILSIKNHSISTVMAQVLILAYCLFWFPFGYSLLHIIRNKESTLMVASLMDATMFLGFMSSFIKVPIFLYFKEDYRQVFQLMLKTSPFYWAERLKFHHRKWERRHQVFYTDALVFPFNIPDHFQQRNSELNV